MAMKPYYAEDGILLYHGDCREILPELPPADMVLADPPYDETDLDWDDSVRGWLDPVRLKVSGSLWCFGSMRFFMRHASDLSGWTFAQDVVWEKHNGSSFHADRFRRVHEHACHFYRGSWKDLYKEVVHTRDAVKKTVQRKARPQHMGVIGPGSFISEDGGPRMMRSVIEVPSCHGYAVHPTQKPLGILTPLVEYSCPPGGLVVDPFAGSGSSLVAAKHLGRRAAGVEIDEKYCEIAARRLSQGTLFQPAGSGRSPHDSRPAGAEGKATLHCWEKGGNLSFPEAT